MKVKAKRVYRLPDGGSYKKDKKVDYPTEITYLDVLEEDCWNLFKSYAGLVGVSFCDDETNFYIAKEIQEKIISLIEENLGVGFPIIGTNENGVFCKIIEKKPINTEWLAKMKIEAKNPDKDLMETIFFSISKGCFGGCADGVCWEVDLSINDEELYHCPEFWTYIVSELSKNHFSGKFNKEVNVNHYIIDGKKYSAAEVFKESCENPNMKSPCFIASLYDILGEDFIV